MWILWALLSALFSSLRRTNEKQIAKRLNHFTIGFLVQLFSLPVILIATIISGGLINPLNLKLGFWLPLIVVCIGFYPLNAFLYLKSIKHGELSKVLPIQSLLPMFSILPGWLILKQVPTILACLGIGLTVLGIYVLGMNGKSLHHPLKPFKHDLSARYMVFNVALVTIAGTLDKIAINNSNALFYSLLSTVGASIILWITLRIYKINELKVLNSSLRNLSFIATLQGSSYTTYLLAIAAGPVAYVFAIRSINILIGSVLGIVVLKEKFTKHKLTSMILILIGGTLIAIGS